jgi:hypothetical protein
MKERRCHAMAQPGLAGGGCLTALQNWILSVPPGRLMVRNHL